MEPILKQQEREKRKPRLPVSNIFAIFVTYVFGDEQTRRGFSLFRLHEQTSEMEVSMHQPARVGRVTAFLLGYELLVGKWARASFTR